MKTSYMFSVYIKPSKKLYSPILSGILMYGVIQLKNTHNNYIIGHKTLNSSVIYVTSEAYSLLNKSKRNILLGTEKIVKFEYR